MPSAMPSPAGRKGQRPSYGASPPAAWSASTMALAAWAMSCVLAWHSIVDVVSFVALALDLTRDPRTVFTGVKGVEFRRKHLVSRGLSLVDVKHVKNALGCVRDVNVLMNSVQYMVLSLYSAMQNPVKLGEKRNDHKYRNNSVPTCSSFDIF
jgi:hypothetical protein